MLTSIFYYTHYKPYLVKDITKPTAKHYKRLKTTQKDALENQNNANFLLNNALRADVVDYMRNVSQSVVGTKDAAKMLVNDTDEFDKNVIRRGFQLSRDWICDDLDIFVSAYNYSSQFWNTQRHSTELRDFSNNIKEDILYHINPLKLLGVTQNEFGLLDYQKDAVMSKDERELGMALSRNRNLFQNIYIQAGDILREPLTEHMKFKNLTYYYSYKFGSIQEDTFIVIEAGLILDSVV